MKLKSTRNKFIWRRRTDNIKEERRKRTKNKETNKKTERVWPKEVMKNQEKHIRTNFSTSLVYDSIYSSDNPQRVDDKEYFIIVRKSSFFVPSGITET